MLSSCGHWKGVWRSPPLHNRARPPWDHRCHLRWCVTATGARSIQRQGSIQPRWAPERAGLEEEPLFRWLMELRVCMGARTQAGLQAMRSRAGHGDREKMSAHCSARLFVGLGHWDFKRAECDSSLSYMTSSGWRLRSSPALQGLCSNTARKTRSFSGCPEEKPRSDPAGGSKNHCCNLSIRHFLQHNLSNYQWMGWHEVITLTVFCSGSSSQLSPVAEQQPCFEMCLNWGVINIFKQTWYHYTGNPDCDKQPGGWKIPPTE